MMSFVGNRNVRQPEGVHFTVFLLFGLTKRDIKESYVCVVGIGRINSS